MFAILYKEELINIMILADSLTMVIFVCMNAQILMLLSISVLSSLSQDELKEELEWRISQLPHHRDKRFVFLTDEKRFETVP